MSVMHLVSFLSTDPMCTGFHRDMFHRHQKISERPVGDFDLFIRLKYWSKIGDETWTG